MKWQRIRQALLGWAAPLEERESWIAFDWPARSTGRAQRLAVHVEESDPCTLLLLAEVCPDELVSLRAALQENARMRTMSLVCSDGRLVLRQWLAAGACDELTLRRTLDALATRAAEIRALLTQPDDCAALPGAIVAALS